MQGGGSYIIAAAQAKFASAFGLEMKLVELMPAKMAGKSEAELRGDTLHTCSALESRPHSLCQQRLGALKDEPCVSFSARIILPDQILVEVPVTQATVTLTDSRLHKHQVKPVSCSAVTDASSCPAGQDIKTTKGYVMRSLLPPKCRSIVRKPNVNDAFAMFVLSLIDLAPSKKLSEGGDCDRACTHASTLDLLYEL